MLIAIILFYFFNNIAFAFSSDERVCASMIYLCEGKKAKSENCQKMRKLVRDLKYSCSKVNKNTVHRVFACYENKDNQEYNLNKPNWLAVSWDIENPKIFGYCDNPAAESARKCAIKKCYENGGKTCKPLCDVNTGVRLRACRLGVLTYVAGSKYGRFGCGTRHVKAGKFTVDGYAVRELNRCKRNEENMKSPCAVMKVWK